MDPKKIVTALSLQNVDCKINEDFEYLSNLGELFPKWKHLESFSTLDITTKRNPWGHELFHENEKEYMGLFSRDDVLSLNKDSGDERFLIIGYSALGDYLVIDTYSDNQEIVGLIDHSLLIEDQLSFEDSYQTFDCDLSDLLQNLEMHFESL